jgi:hypothetical protein
MKRLRAAEGTNLHYSAVYSLSHDDYFKLRENLMRVIQENLAVVRPSREEMIVCQTMDLIPLSAN